MANDSPKLIIIAGLPGVGKTTLARQLANRFKCTLLEKDTVKESLADTLSMEWSSEWSAELGAASEETLFRLAALQIQLGNSVIVETPMLYNRSWERLYLAIQELKVHIRVIVCDCSKETHRQRLANRRKERHAIHSFRGEDFEFILSQREEFQTQLSRQNLPCLLLDMEETHKRLQTQCELFLNKNVAETNPKTHPQS